MDPPVHVCQDTKGFGHLGGVDEGKLSVPCPTVSQSNLREIVIIREREGDGEED